MSINEDSEKDVDILKKKIGGDYKAFIKQNSNDYSTKLKSELMKGFQTFFDELNKKVSEELSAQEKQQKSLHDKLDKKEKKLEDLTTTITHRKTVDYREKIFKVDTTLKIKAFIGLKEYAMKKKETRKREALFSKLLTESKIRKVFKVFKTETIFAQTHIYDEKTKNQIQNEVTKLEDTFKRQKDDMWNLIKQAEEKLKHENRKKVQVKLLLDQMVLRGISALNIQAVNLSQNSLKGKIYFFIFRCC